MASCYLLCALIMCLKVCVATGNTHVKGLFCQDPDTRKLYPINSTWPSESFCGNYTCKLRQKNVTQTEYTPVAKINITEQGEKDKTSFDDMETSPSQQSNVVIKKVPGIQPEFHKEAINVINSKMSDFKLGSETDRYLTEAEIKSITEILHTIKKSDLEAIVEIYNIAQDLYKEIANERKVGKDDMNDNTIKTDESKSKITFGTNRKDSVSYWYEPLHQVIEKAKPDDLKVEGTYVVPTSKTHTHSGTYFRGPLTDRDFRKLPYYYPMSSFHRMASYVHTKPPQNFQNNIPKSCNKKLNNIAPTWVNTHTYNIKPEPTKPQMMQPMQLLPYPFSYVNQYNYTYPSNFYFNYPWAQLNPYSRIKNNPQQYFGAYIAQSPNNDAVVNDEEIEQKVEEHFNSQENTDSINKAEEANLPEWQTEQLSDKVLEEVKANVLEDSKLLKPLNIAKNIKLEKVGKVVKLDELTRTKRDVNNIDDKENEIVQYEAYLDKTICESSNEVGYFRMGNLTAEYPACCPQKIS